MLDESILKKLFLGIESTLESYKSNNTNVLSKL